MLGSETLQHLQCLSHYCVGWRIQIDKVPLDLQLVHWIGVFTLCVGTRTPASSAEEGSWGELRSLRVQWITIGCAMCNKGTPLLTIEQQRISQHGMIFEVAGWTRGLVGGTFGVRESPARLYHWRRSAGEIFHFSGYFTTMVPGGPPCDRGERYRCRGVAE